MELNHSLAISGFVLSILIFLITVGLSFSLGRKIKQLKQFKKQAVGLFTDYSARNILLVLAGSMFLFSVVCLVLFILNEVFETDPWLISFECCFLIQMIVAVTFLVLLQRWGSALLVVVKNQNLITINDIINLQTVVMVQPTKHHHFFLIDYRDQVVVGNIKQTKLKYSWRLKDFLIETGFLPKEVRKND